MFWYNLFILFFICASQSVATGTNFRFDYHFDSQANGWLKLHRVPTVWNDARLICHAEGAVLASPLALPLRTSITHFVSKHSSVQHIFIGVHASFFKGTYASVEGIPLSRLSIDWAPGQPDNYNNSESCLVMSTGGNSNGTVMDVTCTDVFPYVCYKKQTSLELTGCGTTDPEYKLDARTGSCYKFHKWGLTWPQAYMTCIAEGGYLAIVNSVEESALLSKLYKSYTDKMIFSKNPHIASVGFLKWGDPPSWMTIHGETLMEAGFNQWHENGPDNVTRGPDFSSELCGSILRTGAINDVACNLVLPFICEMKPELFVRYGELIHPLEESKE